LPGAATCRRKKKQGTYNDMPSESDSMKQTLRFHYARIVQLSLASESSIDDDIETATDEQTAAVEKSQLGALLKRLSKLEGESFHQRGDYLMSLAVRFYAANGMTHRFPRKKLQVMKGTPTFEEESQFLRRLQLWKPPNLIGAGKEGENSLRHVDQRELATIAQEFFRTQVRCAWFEKMLVQSLIGAETYAFGESLKSEPRLSGNNSMLWAILVGFVYDRSKGASPKYEIYMWCARMASSVFTLLAILGFGWYALHLVDTDRPIRGYLLATVTAMAAAKLFGRYLILLIVRWVNSVSGDTIHAMRGFQMIRLGSDALTLYSHVCHDNMNPKYARDLLASCIERSFVVDPILFAFLDRAVCAAEFRWASWYEQPLAYSYDSADQG
jgi:hypothetical protein